MRPGTFGRNVDKDDRVIQSPEHAKDDLDVSGFKFME